MVFYFLADFCPPPAHAVNKAAVTTIEISLLFMVSLFSLLI
jgi:hypothetical protein